MDSAGYFTEACEMIQEDVERTKDIVDSYVSIVEQDAKSVTVYDCIDCNEGVPDRSYVIHNPAFMDASYFRSLMRVSDDVKELPYRVDLDVLADYMANHTDTVMSSTVQRIVFCTGDEEDEDSLFKDSLLSDSIFEAGHDLPSDGLVGLRWWENDVVLVNLKKIIETSQDVLKADGNRFTEDDLMEELDRGVVVTLLHEVRHCAQENPYLSEERFSRLSFDFEIDAEEYARDCYDRSPVSVISKNRKKQRLISRPLQQERNGMTEREEM